MSGRNYYKIRLGNKGQAATECRAGGFVGADYGLKEDLTGRLPDDWRAFNKEFAPIYLQSHPDKSRIAAGLACGSIYVVSKGMEVGDVVLCPTDSGDCLVGEVSGDYYYRPGETLPHRRPVRWYDVAIERSRMSEELRSSMGSRGTHSKLTKHAAEIESLLKGQRPAQIVATDDTIEDPAVFALEKHLEDFLVQNWHQTELGKMYDIFEEDGELVGQQFETDTGRIDILAVSKDRSALLVVELKKGRASDVVVGQVQRYMGYVVEELAEEDQSVRGLIIAFDDDVRIRRALRVAQNIDFYTYEVSFRLRKV